MFDWREFLNIADELGARLDSESAQRSAISRAYYAAYHAASTFARDTGLPVGRHSHQAVWDAFASHPNQAYADAGAMGLERKRIRTAADYWPDYGADLTRDANLAPEQARALFALIDSLS